MVLELNLNIFKRFAVLLLFVSCVQEIPLEELENETFVDPTPEAGSVSNPIPLPDQIPPKILATSPMGTVPASTQSVLLQVQTDETAECRYDLSLKSFDFMVNNLPSSNGGTLHSRSFAVTQDTAYLFYILCRDSNQNISLASQLNFKVDKMGVVDNVAPMLSSLLPAGKVASGTTQAMLQVSTNEASTCRYSNSSVVNFDGMLSFQTSNNFSHFATVSGLQNGGSYTYYVLCRDTAQNLSTKQLISFSVDSLELDGKILYANNCMSCHSGLDTSTKKNKTAQQIQNAINNVAAMNLAYLKALEASQVLAIAEVLKVASPVDTAAPVISMAQPSGTQPSTITSINLQVMTNEVASCRYSQTNQSYDQMGINLNASGGGTSHSRTVSVQVDTSYTYYVRCSDSVGNKSTSSTIISFYVDKLPDIVAPIISNISPSGKLPAGTKSIQLSFSTNENSTCRYSSSSAATFTQMALITQTGDLAHNQTISNLSDGNSYSYYVLCRDGANNTSTKVSTSFTVETPVVISLDERARGILNSRCLNCHGGAFTYKQLNINDDSSLFDPLNKFIVKGIPDESKIFQSLTGVNNISMMPPSGIIPDSERETIRQWIAAMQPDNNGNDEIICDIAEDNKSPLTRRLTKVEIENSFAELLGASYKPDLSSLPDPGVSQFGMTRNGRTQGGYSPQAIESLMLNFEGVVSSVANNNAIAANCASLTGSSLNSCLDTNLIPIVERAWRRVLSSTERQVIYSYFQNRTFKQGMSIALLKTFLSPRFLFISYDDNISPRKLNNFEIAERLAFLVTARVPSQALMNTAKTTDLSIKANLIIEMNKLFDSNNISNAGNLQRSKGWSFYKELQNQWLGLKDLDKSSAGNNEASMKWANMFFLEEMFKNNRSIEQMLTDNFVVVDRNLASIYEVDFNSAQTAGYDIYNSPSGFRRLVVPESSRKGLLTQAAILTVNAKTNASGEVNPTHRGLWYAEKIMCDTPDGLPSGVDLDTGKITTGSLKERFAAHVDESTSCFGCHKVMDPIGFGLWGYDGEGREREKDTWGFPIDPSGQLEGQFFQETQGMIDIIAQSNKTEQCIMSHLTSYIVARDVDSKKSCKTQEILKDIKNKNGGLRDILHEIVSSDLFVMRK